MLMGPQMNQGPNYWQDYQRQLAERIAQQQNSNVGPQMMGTIGQGISSVLGGLPLVGGIFQGIGGGLGMAGNLLGQQRNKRMMGW